MRLGRAKQKEPKALPLPPKGESVTLSTPGGGRIPARVLESVPDSVLLAITVATRPLDERQLAGLLMEFHSPRGRVRVQGAFAIEDPREPDVLRLTAPRSIEVLQERDYVRIEAARPVLVYGASGGTQVESFTVDLSGGGFLLAGPDTLTVGEEIRFRLALSSGEPAVTGTGRVVRVDARGRRAVCFESISELDRRRLVRFIFECQRDERRRGGGRDS